MKEKLQEYALIAEIISALAVVAGLIFVGLEIRQGNEQSALNTRALEVASYQNLIEQILEINNLVIPDSQLMDLVIRGGAGELKSENEEGRYRRYILNIMRHADMACFQYQQGIISEERMIAVMGIYAGNVSYEREFNDSTFPGLQSCLERARPFLNELTGPNVLRNSE